MLKQGAFLRRDPEALQSLPSEQLNYFPGSWHEQA